MSESQHAANTKRRPSRFMATIGLALVTALGVGSITSGTSAAGPNDRWELPRASIDPSSSASTETVVLAGGCFWGVQAVYQRIDGVISAVSGYAGGSEATATYRRVLQGGTGHAEAVEIVFDPSVISFGEILRIFFSVAHDPTQLNRQGSDIGPHYRSHIFTTTRQQGEVATAYIAQLDAADIYEAPIVTLVDPFSTFFPAEGYHQDYLVNNGAGDPNGPNIRYLDYWDRPKLVFTEQLFPEYWRSSPVLVAATHPELVN